MVNKYSELRVEEEQIKRAVFGLPLKMKANDPLLILHPCKHTKRGVVAESILLPLINP